MKNLIQLQNTNVMYVAKKDMAIPVLYRYAVSAENLIKQRNTCVLTVIQKVIRADVLWTVDFVTEYIPQKAILAAFVE